MSEFHELIKSFPKTREYVRDFYIYGFKSREDFLEKSARTYDNERRRLESWLSPYIQTDYHDNKKLISLQIDPNLERTNPLYRILKAKSFTDNDLLLHFSILSIMKNRRSCTVEQITSQILDDYGLLFDSQLVRKKLVEYRKEGLISQYKKGKENLYHLSPLLSLEGEDMYEAFVSCMSLFQLIAPFGFVGSTILDFLRETNTLFTSKHNFFVHTLEDEVLLTLLTAIEQKRGVLLHIRNRKTDTFRTLEAIPLKVFVSTKTGRRYLCIYQPHNRRLQNYRLDTIDSLELQSPCTDYEGYLDKLAHARQYLFGVSFGRSYALDTIQLTLQINEKEEGYILARLRREGKHGCIERIKHNTFTYTITVYDGYELLPFIRTFFGRILHFETNNQSLHSRFLNDFAHMYDAYHTEEKE